MPAGDCSLRPKAAQCTVCAMSPRTFAHLRFVALVLATILASFCVASLVDAAIPMGSKACAGAACEVQIACRPEVPPPPPGSSHVPGATVLASRDDVVRPDGPLGVLVAAPVTFLPGSSVCPLATRAPPASA